MNKKDIQKLFEAYNDVYSGSTDVERLASPKSHEFESEPNTESPLYSAIKAASKAKQEGSIEHDEWHGLPDELFMLDELMDSPDKLQKLKNIISKGHKVESLFLKDGPALVIK